MKCLPKSLFFLFLLGAFGAAAQTGFDTGVPLPSGGTLVVPFDVKDRIEKPYESINVGGETRTYGFYKSTKITGGQRPALVIALHGNTADGNLMAVQTSFDQKAEDESFIVVYPNGKTVTAPTFNIPGIAQQSFQWAVEDAAIINDDMDFFNDLIDIMIADHNIDPQRVYMCGESGGGFRTFHATESLANRLAAVAIFAALTPRDVIASVPCRLMPILHIHGTGDTQVDYDNVAFNPVFNNANYFDVESGIDEWTSINAVINPATVTTNVNTNTTDGSSVDIDHYFNSWFAPTRVRRIRVNNGGHLWPGGYSAYPVWFRDDVLELINNFFPNFGNMNLDISATDEMWNFFRHNRLNQNNIPAFNPGQAYPVGAVVNASGWIMRRANTSTFLFGFWRLERDCNSISPRLAVADLSEEKIAQVQAVLNGGEAMAFSVYPNPANGETVIRIDNFQGEMANVELKDMNGRSVMAWQLAGTDGAAVQETIDLNGVASGVYFLQLQSGNTFQVERLVKR
ncbi:MAG: T9SS type A sorting domain-containing protein [Salibacteraceae bacterium]